MSPRAKGRGGQRGGDSCVILRNVSACTTATKLRLLYVTSAMHSPLFLVFFVFCFFFFRNRAHCAGSICSHRAGGRSSRVQINRRPRVSRFRGFLLADG